MKSVVLLLVLVGKVLALNYGDLSEERFVSDWHEIKPELEGVWDTVKVASLGIVPGEAIGSTFQDVIDKKTKSTVYLFDKGTYKFTAPIYIMMEHDGGRVPEGNIIIKGAGPDETTFAFDCDVDYFGGLIWAESKAGYGDRNKPLELSVVPKQGDKTITLASTNSFFKVGSYVSVKQDNPPELMLRDEDKNEAWYDKWKNDGETADWAVESYGEFNRIVSISGNTATLEHEIALNAYDAKYNPRVSVYPEKHMAKNIGVKDLSLEHIVSDSRYTPGGKNDIFGIVFRFTVNGFVDNVRSYNTARGHVMIEYAYNIAVVNSHFKDARNYGVGGAGYGVCVQNRSSDIYIANNEFEHLRHAVVLKEGACRTVVAYNWSHDWAILDPSVVDGGGNKIEAEADMSIHGFYSHSNLFEGNVCHNIFYADYWGPTGPRTVAFRNRVYGDNELDGIYVDDYSLGESVIANIIPGQGKLFISEEIKDAFVEGNVVGGVAQWSSLSEDAQLPASLYLNGEPSFWESKYSFPSFGPDVAGSENNTIPAMQENQLAIGDNSESHVVFEKVDLSIAPNPFNPVTTISFNAIVSGSKVTVYDIKGRELISRDFEKMGNHTFTFNGSKYASGVYFVRAVTGFQVVTKKMILIK